MNKSKLVVVVVSFIVIIIAIIIITIYLTRPNISPFINNPISYSVSYNNLHPQDTKSEYVGVNIKSSLPNGWHIVEYEDENGIFAGSSNEEIQYFGLTGFKILNSINQTVFNMGGVDGVGGNGACNPIYKFPDTQQEYVNYERDKTIAYGFDNPIDPKVIDLSSNYSTINLFNKSIRRINTELYWISSDNFENKLNSFNPACGLDASFIRFDNINFKIKDLRYDSISEGNLYKLIIMKENTQESDFSNLDEVLNSLESK